ncbi:MAG: SatD family protein [Vitreimonas sp.]
MPAPNKPRAVLMGDLVGSEKAASAKAVHRVFNRAIARANKRHAAQILSPLTITLGDEFQGLISSFVGAWTLAAELRLGLLHEGVSCRFVVGAATIETPLNRARAWNMMGPGLADARAKLNDKGLANAYRFSFPSDPVIAELMEAVGASLTHVEQGWTDTQLRYFWRRAEGRAIARIAKDLGVSQRGVYKVLRAAHADFHDRQSEAIGRALTHLDTQHGLA